MKKYPIFNTEDIFSEFVEQYGGISLNKKFKEHPNPSLNADYYFEKDQVVAELKSLEVDSINSKKGIRKIFDSYSKHKEKDDKLHQQFLDFAFGRGNIPKPIYLELLSSIRRTFETAIKKANKQIRETKKFYGIENKAMGLVLICNDGNLVLDPAFMFSIVCKLMVDNFMDSEIDGIVYFTINYPTTDTNEPYEFMYWMPSYRIDNSPLASFVNKMGHEWWTFYKSKIGEEELDTPHLKGEQAFKKILKLMNLKSTPRDNKNH